MYFINKLIITTLSLEAFCQIVRGQYFYGDDNGYQYNYKPPQMVRTSRAGSGRYYYPDCQEMEQTGEACACNNPILATQRVPAVMQKLPPQSDPSCVPSPQEICMSPPSLPIDPVSLALAYSKAQKGYNIREEKLNFGAIRKPVECEVVETACNVPEDGLYAFKNQIVELRPSCRRIASPAEEAALSYFNEDDCDCDCDCDCDASINYPSYQDLGYVPECPVCPKFQPVVPPPSQLPAPPICRNPNSGSMAAKTGYQRADDCDYNDEVRNTLMRKFSPRLGNSDS